MSLGSITSTSVSISWSVPTDSVVDIYEVMWNRPTEDDPGRVVITDGSTEHTITGLIEGSTYIITVTATNVAGSATSDSVSAMTSEGIFTVRLFHNSFEQ